MRTDGVIKMMDGSSDLLCEDLLIEIENCAVDMARGAALILGKHFGTSLEVEYKDKGETDPVTQVDKECQEFLIDAISKRFPCHGIVGEEDAPKEDSAAPEIVWVLDPLDGTKNFLSGYPVYASSIGVLHRGTPVVGVIYVPWPDCDEGSVFRARVGAGAFVNEERLSVFEAKQPDPVRLVALPGSLRGFVSFGELARGQIGEVRVTGSIAHELAMTCKGVLQYTITMNPHLWDVAAGALLVREAGGIVMAGTSAGKSIVGYQQTWTDTGSLISNWKEGETTMQQLRNWSQPLVLGGPDIVTWVTANLSASNRRPGRLANILRSLNPRL